MQMAGGQYVAQVYDLALINVCNVGLRSRLYTLRFRNQGKITVWNKNQKITIEWNGDFGFWVGHGQQSWVLSWTTYASHSHLICMSMPLGSLAAHLLRHGNGHIFPFKWVVPFTRFELNFIYPVIWSHQDNDIITPELSTLELSNVAHRFVKLLPIEREAALKMYWKTIKLVKS